MKQEAAKALERGDLALALDLWREVTRGDTRPADLLEHATLLHQLYRSSEAVPLWDRLLEHSETTTENLLVAAKLWFQLGRFTACVRFTEQALLAYPGCPDIASMHAAALERSGDKKRAKEVALDSLGEHPGHARLVRQIAHIERGEGDFESAKQRLELQLRESPSADDWRLRYELAAVLDRMGDHAAAMRELGEAKQQLAPRSAIHRPLWRAISARQWELTRALTTERLARWDESESAMAERLCLMAGFPRSGTTLLEQVIGAHPGCIGTDESGILATQFRDPVIFAAASADDAIDELESYTAEDLAAGRSEYFRCTADVLGQAPGGRLLLEKDPLLTADLAIPLRLFPGAKLLMPLRDPRDVVISFYFTIVPTAPNSVAAATLEETCIYYAEVMRHWLLLRERLDPSRWMESRYEDLLADPETQTKRLAGFLNLDWRPEMLAHHQRRHERRNVSTPTYDDVSQPLYSRSLGRWRRYEEWLAPHLHHLEPYLEAFGYGRSPVAKAL